MIEPNHITVTISDKHAEPIEAVKELLLHLALVRPQWFDQYSELYARLEAAELLPGEQALSQPHVAMNSQPAIAGRDTAAVMDGQSDWRELARAGKSLAFVGDRYAVARAITEAYELVAEADQEDSFVVLPVDRVWGTVVVPFRASWPKGGIEAGSFEAARRLDRQVLVVLDPRAEEVWEITLSIETGHQCIIGLGERGADLSEVPRLATVAV